MHPGAACCRGRGVGGGGGWSPQDVPSSPPDLCSGDVPAPDNAEDMDASVEGQEEPPEDKERQQKMQLFEVKDSFEAKDQLFPEMSEKSSLPEELPAEELPADVHGEPGGQEPGGVLPTEAPQPSPGAAWEGRWWRSALLGAPGWFPLLTAV